MAKVSTAAVSDDELAHLQARFARLRAAFQAEPYPDAASRRAQLDKLRALLKAEQHAIVTALDQDFAGREPHETRLLELFPSLMSLRHARRHVARWMRPERRSVSLWYQPGRAAVHYQPLGVVGIISPWNYPLYLSIAPIAGALAAGNRVLLKLSEATPAFGALLERLFNAHFPGWLEVVTGGPGLGAAFSALPFDHLVFTGSTATGRKVMAAAAPNLTPLTLELGGKSPAFIAPEFDVATAAKRIAFGKLMNSGQTCVAPDYVLVHKDKLQPFIEALRNVVQGFYGKRGSLTQIIDERHHRRLQGYLDEAQAEGAQLLPLLDAPLAGRRILPMALLGTTDTMKVMQEEIFGPLLPIHSYETLEEAMAFINNRDRPLALYLFDEDAERVKTVLTQTHSGGVSVNDCLLHVAQDSLPFGGVGPSGMGHHHGFEGFKALSHARGVFYQSRVNSVSLFHPPFSALAKLMLKVMMR